MVWSNSNESRGLRELKSYNLFTQQQTHTLTHTHTHTHTQAKIYQQRRKEARQKVVLRVWALKTF